MIIKELYKYFAQFVPVPVLIKAMERSGDNEHAAFREQVLHNLQRAGEYLCHADYDSLDYGFALDYFSHRNPVPAGGCTSVRKGGFFGRNFDWYYDRRMTCVLNVAGNEDWPASLCVAGNVPGLDLQEVLHGSNPDAYRLLPFFTLDGINSSHVFCNTNVVPLDKGPTPESIPLVEQRERICAAMLCRYILDHFHSAAEAIAYIRDYVAVYMPQSLQDMGYEMHFMVGDGSSTYAVEFIGGDVVAIEADVMTNFHLAGVTPNGDGTVYTPADVPLHSASENGITPFGSGLERYNYAVKRLDSADSRNGMRALMNGLLYSRTYLSARHPARPVWHTEYVGRLTVDDPADEFLDVEERYAETFRRRDRDTPETDVRTWHSVHSSVYDIEDLSLRLVSQERTALEYRYSVHEASERRGILQDYIFGVNEEKLRQRISSVTGMYLFVEYSNATSSRDPKVDVKTDRLHVAVTVAEPMPTDQDLVDEALSQDRCMKVLAGIRRKMRDDFDRLYGITWVEFPSTMQPFHAVALANSLGWSMEFDVVGVDII